MKASDVKLRELHTFGDCMEAVEAIERDWKNVEGGWKAWDSCGPTYLKAGAEKKIEAIKRRAERISPGSFED